VNKFINPIYSEVFLPFNQGDHHWYFTQTYIENNTDRIVTRWQSPYGRNFHFVYANGPVFNRRVPEESEIRIVPTVMSMRYRWRDE
jgi:hypothetical protein